MESLIKWFVVIVFGLIGAVFFGMDVKYRKRERKEGREIKEFFTSWRIVLFVVLSMDVSLTFDFLVKPLKLSFISISIYLGLMAILFFAMDADYRRIAKKEGIQAMEFWTTGRALSVAMIVGVVCIVLLDVFS